MPILKFIFILSASLLFYVGCKSDTDNNIPEVTNRTQEEPVKIVFDQDTLNMQSNFYYSGNEELRIKFAFVDIQDSSEWKNCVEELLPKIGYFGKQTFKDLNAIYFYKKDTTQIYNLDSLGGVSIQLYAKNRSLHHRFYQNTSGTYKNIPEFNAEKAAGACMNYSVLLDQYIYIKDPKNSTFTLFEISFKKNKIKLDLWSLNSMQGKIDKLWEKRKNN